MSDDAPSVFTRADAKRAFEEYFAMVRALAPPSIEVDIDEKTQTVTIKNFPRPVERSICISFTVLPVSQS